MQNMPIDCNYKDFDTIIRINIDEAAWRFLAEILSQMLAYINEIEIKKECFNKVGVVSDAMSLSLEPKHTVAWISGPRVAFWVQCDPRSVLAVSLRTPRMNTSFFSLSIFLLSIIQVATKLFD